jgi:hypothetical protein
MNEQEVAIKLNDHDHEIGSLMHRVKGCEENQKALAEPTIEQIDPTPFPRPARAYIKKSTAYGLRRQPYTRKSTAYGSSRPIQQI